MAASGSSPRSMDEVTVVLVPNVCLGLPNLHMFMIFAWRKLLCFANTGQYVNCMTTVPHGTAS